MDELGSTHFFRAVGNAEGDGGVWPAGWQVPSGWRADAFTGDIDSCAKYLALLAPGGEHRDQWSVADGGPLVERLVSVAEAHHDEPALRDHDLRLTYHGLYRAARVFAEHLAAAGVAAADRVVVLLEPTADVVVAVVGTLLAGATCVPVCAAEYPQQRRTVVSDARPVALVGDSDASHRHGRGVVVLDASLWRSACAATHDDGVGRWPADAGPVRRQDAAAFWMYSRYSAAGCGTAMVWRQRQLATLASDCGLPRIGPGDRVALTAVPDSALTVVQMLHGLLSGAELVADRARWDTGSATGAVRLTLSPSRLPGACWVRVATVDAPPGRAATELIGSVETTMMSAAVGPDGRLSTIPGRRLYVLDDRLRPVGEGRVGRLYVAGAGIASGYASQPELTVRRFLPDPVVGSGARMFCTDMSARRLPDGTLAVAA